MRRLVDRERVVVGNNAMFRHWCLANFRRRGKTVTLFDEETNQLPALWSPELWVDVELRRRRALLLGRRGFLSDCGDHGWHLKRLDLAHGGTLRYVLRLLSKVCQVNSCTSFLEIRCASCDANSFFKEQLDAAFEKSFTVHGCVGYDGYENTQPRRLVHVVHNDLGRG